MFLFDCFSFQGDFVFDLERELNTKRSGHKVFQMCKKDMTFECTFSHRYVQSGLSLWKTGKACCHQPSGVTQLVWPGPRRAQVKQCASHCT